jgi:integrase
MGHLAGDDTRNGAVLRLMAVTSLRVGDVLKIPWTAIDDAFDGSTEGVVVVERKGGRFIEVPMDGSFDEWNCILRGMVGGGFDGDIVASWVTGTPGSSPLAAEAAYQRVNRHLKGIGEDLELPRPVHLHRIRRTVAVQALRTTKDMTMVQQLLGHSSLSSTERYVDELRTRDVARLQKKLGMFRGNNDRRQR